MELFKKMRQLTVEKRFRFAFLPFFLIHVVIALLFLSWLFPPASRLWGRVDYFIFTHLNQMLKNRPFWQNFWAICNHSSMDWVHDIVMLFFYVIYICKGVKEERLRRFSQLVLCILFFFLTILLINKTFVTGYIHPRRESPTMVHAGEAISLSKEVHWIHIKDHSKTCYPGDHGTTACLFAFSIFYLMGWRYGIFAVIYASFFILPRLVVGAHWITDILLGSLPIALFSSSWVLCTPLGELFTSFFSALLHLFSPLIVSPRSSDEST